MDEDETKALELAMMAREMMDSFVDCHAKRLFLEFIRDEFALDGLPPDGAGAGDGMPPDAGSGSPRGIPGRRR